MNAFKVVLDRYCRRIPQEFKETLALHKTALNNAPLTDLYKINNDENSVLFWQLLSTLLEWHSSGETNTKKLEDLLVKMNQLDRAQCDAQLARPAEIGGSLLATDVFDVFWIIYLYAEQAEIKLDITVQIASFLGKTPEYVKLFLLMRVLFLEAKDEELIHYVKTRLEQDLIDPQLWGIEQAGIYEDLTPLYLFVHALLRNLDSSELITIGHMITRKAEPEVWIVPSEEGDTPLCHMMRILRCNPGNNELVALTSEIAHKVDPVGWLIELNCEEEKTTPLFELILAHIENPNNEPISTLVNEVFQRLDSIEEGGTLGVVYRDYITIHSLLHTLASNPDNKEILEQVQIGLIPLTPCAWLFGCSKGVTALFILVLIALQHKANEEMINLVLNVAKQIPFEGWEKAVREGEFKGQTPLYKLMELLYHTSQNPKIHELVEFVIEQTDSVAWSAEGLLKETALHLLCATYSHNHENIKVSGLIKAVIPKTNPATWGVSHKAKDGTQTTPLNELMIAFYKNPYNDELRELIDELVVHADMAAWNFVIPSRLTPLHQLFAAVLADSSNARLIANTKKLLERVVPEDLEVISGPDKEFTLLHLMVLLLISNPKHKVIVTMCKEGIRKSLPSAWNIPIRQSNGEPWDTPLRLLTRALAINHQNEDIIEMASTVSHYVDSALWTQKNTLNNSALYEALLALSNNHSNLQIIDIANIAIERATSDDWFMPILSDSHSADPHIRSLNVMATIMPGIRVVITNDIPGGTPIRLLTLSLSKNSKNEELIRLLEKALRQIDPLHCTKIAVSGIDAGKSHFQRLLIALANNPDHPTLIKCVCSILNSEGYTPEASDIGQILPALTYNNILYFAKLFAFLKVTLTELAFTNSQLFSALCSRTLNALAQPSISEQEHALLDFIQTSSVNMDIWGFLVDESVSEKSTKSKPSKEKHGSSLLSRLLLLLENDLTQDSKIRVMKLLKNSTQFVSIESWKSLEGGHSVEFQQLENLIKKNIDPDLKNQLAELHHLVKQSVEPEHGPKLTKFKKEADVPQERTLWHLVTTLLEHPTKKNATAVAQYPSKKCWGETHRITHPDAHNSWTPWILLIICSLDNKVSYDQQQMSYLFDVISGLITHLPESAWTTPLLNHDAIIEYPMHALITIFNAVKSKPTERNKSSEALRQLTINELKKIIETAVKHLYTKYSSVLDLTVQYGNERLNVVELLFSLLPELKKSNAPIIKKMLSDYYEKLPQHALSIFAKKGHPNEGVAQHPDRAPAPGTHCH